MDGCESLLTGQSVSSPDVLADAQSELELPDEADLHGEMELQCEDGEASSHVLDDEQAIQNGMEETEMQDESCVDEEDQLLEQQTNACLKDDTGERASQTCTEEEGVEGGDLLKSTSTVTDDELATPNASQVFGMLLQSALQQTTPHVNLPEHISLPVSLPDGTLVKTALMQTVQAITLADGSTALIQTPKALAGKLLAGQTITLEDGTTAVVQGIGLSEKMLEPPVQEPVVKPVEGLHSVTLEDGSTVYIPSASVQKENMHAVQLEDGSTALITNAVSDTLFNSNAVLEGSNLEVGQFSAQSLLTGTGTPVSISAEKTIVISDKAFKCQFEGCNRLYTSQHHLKVHERSHTGQRPFKCEFPCCGKAFATGYGLKSHTRVHTGEKPYSCPDDCCNKAFKTSGDLQKHVRTHTGERPFRCPFEGCDRSFTTSNIRKVHIRTHTGEKPYTCPELECARSFASATNYKNHMRIHTGEKPYVCTVAGCGKRFTEYSSLYKHHVVHTHSKPYECNRCGKNYRQTSTLAMHKRMAHGEEIASIGEVGTAHLYVPVVDDGAGEPPMKHARLEFSITTDGGSVEQHGDGTLIINTTDAQQLSLVPSGNLNVVNSDGTALTSPPENALEQFQQLYVMTSPAQIGAFQELHMQTLTPVTHAQIAELQQTASTTSVVQSQFEQLEHTDTASILPPVDHGDQRSCIALQEHDQDLAMPRLEEQDVMVDQGGGGGGGGASMEAELVVQHTVPVNSAPSDAASAIIAFQAETLTGS